ncbi:MAG TPA: PAS domain-containing protein, partial [Chitinophagaceae bacterium]|nr:PAS domain-containing protein [Chitinophagaceae bacterium]
MTTFSTPAFISNAAFSTLVENLQQAILLETPDRRIELVNQAFCDLFHIPLHPEQLIGSDCSNAA